MMINCSPQNLKVQLLEKTFFDTLVNYFANNNVDFKKCIFITTNGAASMTKKHLKVVKLIKGIAPYL